MNLKWALTVLVSLILLTYVSYLQSSLCFYAFPSDSGQALNHQRSPSRRCNLFEGRWISDATRRPIYNASCPFHRNGWNCFRNKRQNMDMINSWMWMPDGCPSPRIDPVQFLESIRNKKIGFVGDSLNENFLIAFLCILQTADGTAEKWKKKGAWRGGYFPRFNVTVAYHRAVLLARYGWQPVNHQEQSGLKGTYRVDVDVPADDWISVTNFYDVFVFNTGHWWARDKFPNETPLIFYKKGKPVLPPIGIFEGLELVLNNMVSYIEREVPQKALIFWRMQSPRHFYGGDWNQNGSCLFDAPLEQSQLEGWFNPKNGGVNQEAREVNRVIEGAVKGREIIILNLTHLSEFRVDAHPATWLGQRDAVTLWGQDCLHWCLPGLPDTWVDILASLILHNLASSQKTE